nr:hypothetical protein [Tanacetum cinerariifolium]
MSILTSEKHTEPNFTNWHRNLRIALRYEKKLVHLEQPLQPAPDPATATPKVVDAYYDLVNAQQEVACLMLARGWSVCELSSLEYEELLRHFGAHWLPYVAGTWCESYLESLNKNYEQFVQNYNMHSMEKTIAELHVMRKLVEKGLPKKAKTHVVLAIRGGKTQKDKKQPQGS